MFWFRFLAGVLKDIENGGQEGAVVAPGHVTAAVTPAGNQVLDTVSIDDLFEPPDNADRPRPTAQRTAG